MSLLVGNLHAEHAWAGDRTTETRPSLNTAAAAATLLRVFAADGDVVWLPALVDPARIAPVAGLPTCRFVTEIPPVTDGRLAWAETADLPQWSPRREPIGVGWIDALWRTPPPDPGVAGCVNDRGFDLEVSRALGVVLPGAAIGDTWEATAAAIRGIVDGAESAAWIVKASLSAAGRHRVRGEGVTPLRDPATRAAIEGLLARGPVRVEPWLAKIRDLAVAGIIGADGATRLVGEHEMEVDARGRFRGARTGSPVPVMQHVARDVGGALAEAGYSGPFGIDGLEHRIAGDEVRLHPLVEINARLTFGHVLHAAAARLGREALAIRFAKGGVPAGGVATVRPDGASAVAAWFEVG